MKRKYSIIVVGLSICLFIYLFYRTTNTVVNELIVLLLSPATYTQIRSEIVATLPLGELVKYSLPGGLWVFCLTILCKDLYLPVGKHKILLISVPILFAIGLEFLQLMHVTNGTFDPADMGLYLAFWLLACNLFPSSTSHQNILSPFTLRGFVCVACFLSVYLAHVST